MEQSRDFDQRLGTVLNLAFQHSKNLDSTFKVIEYFLKIQINKDVAFWCTFVKLISAKKCLAYI